MNTINNDIDRQRERNTPPKIIGSSVSHTQPPDAYNYATQEDTEKESLFHPVKAVEDILFEFKKLHAEMNLLLKAMQKQNTFFDTTWAVGLNVGYTTDYKGMPFMSVFNPTSSAITLMYSTGGGPAIVANKWTHISPPRGSVITISGGSDSAPQVLTFRVGEYPYSS